MQRLAFGALKMTLSEKENFYNFKGLRAVWRPIWELKKWRSQQKDKLSDLELKTWQEMKWLAFWLSIVFFICLISSCNHLKFT